MAISTKVITMRQGNKADYQASKMLAGELAVINDTEELHYSPKSGKSIRVATENDLKELENKIPAGGGSFSGSAKDVTYDDSQTQLGATNVQEAIGKVSEQMNDLKENGTTGGTGWTTEQINLLDSIGNFIPFTSTDGGTLWDNLINSLKGNSSGGDEPDTPVVPEVTLSAISVTYGGGDVAVGTELTDLTGITVKAVYSDGTSEVVTDYTLSGEIVEGSNTITVSYSDKTATFTVVGIAESTGGSDSWESGVAFDLTGKIISNTDLNASGVETSSEGASCTDYIYCYGAEYVGFKTTRQYIHFYDASKTFLSRADIGSTYVEVPDNAVYLRIAEVNRTYWALSESVELIPVKTTNNFTSGNNAVTWEPYEILTTGELSSASSASVTNIVPVGGATSIVNSADLTVSKWALYDANQNVLLVKQNPDLSSLPPYASFIRFQVHNQNKFDVITLE